MTLAEALFRVARRDGDPATHEIACGVVLQALRGLARGLAGNDVDAGEEAASRVLVRLLTGAPRIDDGWSEEQARGYLAAAVRNALRDAWRAAHDHVEIDSVREVADERLVEDVLLAVEAERHAVDALGAARSLLFDRVLPALRAAGQGGAAAAEAIDQLRAIREGTTTMQDLVDREAGPDPGPQRRRQARNLLDQRFSRAMRRAHAAIDGMAVAGEILPDRAEDARAVLRSLRLRHA